MVATTRRGAGPVAHPSVQQPGRGAAPGCRGDRDRSLACATQGSWTPSFCKAPSSAVSVGIAAARARSGPAWKGRATRPARTYRSSSRGRRRRTNRRSTHFGSAPQRQAIAARAPITRIKTMAADERTRNADRPRELGRAACRSGRQAPEALRWGSAVGARSARAGAGAARCGVGVAPGGDGRGRRSGAEGHGGRPARTAKAPKGPTAASPETAGGRRVAAAGAGPAVVLLGRMDPLCVLGEDPPPPVVADHRTRAYLEPVSPVTATGPR